MGSYWSEFEQENENYICNKRRLEPGELRLFSCLRFGHSNDGQK